MDIFGWILLSSILYPGSCCTPLIYGTIWIQGGCGWWSNMWSNLPPKHCLYCLWWSVLILWRVLHISPILGRFYIGRRMYVELAIMSEGILWGNGRYILWCILGFLIWWAPLPTPATPVFRDCVEVVTWVCGITIVRGVVRGGIWPRIQNWNSDSGISRKKIMWYIEEDGSVWWGGIIGGYSCGWPVDLVCKFLCKLYLVLIWLRII